MSTIPHANNFPLFKCRNAAGAVVDLRGPQPFTREIEDYVLDSSKLACEACGARVRHCAGQACINHFHQVIAPAGKQLLEIRPAGNLGWGVFASQPIPDGTVLGEYLGELVPDFQSLPAGDRYGLELEGLDIVCTARRFGNITRFINHHCEPNVIVETGMYGRRLVEIFRADEDIAAGDQVFISYGRAYFEGLGISCQCDDQPGAHLPPPDGGDSANDSDIESEIAVAVKAVAKVAGKQAMGMKTAATKQAGAQLGGDSESDSESDTESDTESGTQSDTESDTESDTQPVTQPVIQPVIGVVVSSGVKVAGKRAIGKKTAAAKHNPARPMGKKSAKGQHNPNRPMGKKSAKGHRNPAPRNPAPRRLTRVAGVWKR
ncbi:hypothetical protein VPNG_09660 [Cytospora leucostoma]|uniref:SET domain-containing protein n=1 Tax=Cytospora leucostoma TaxID=1230097 RepID=A0A423VMJ3_9PEZI|nr:hypothetical protein VPNG_09660 [Cytospora leucostoma]